MTGGKGATQSPLLLPFPSSPTCPPDLLVVQIEALIFPPLLPMFPNLQKEFNLFFKVQLRSHPFCKANGPVLLEFPSFLLLKSHSTSHTTLLVNSAHITVTHITTGV